MKTRYFTLTQILVIFSMVFSTVSPAFAFDTPSNSLDVQDQGSNDPCNKAGVGAGAGVPGNVKGKFISTCNAVGLDFMGEPNGDAHQWEGVWAQYFPNGTMVYNENLKEAFFIDGEYSNSLRSAVDSDGWWLGVPDRDDKIIASGAFWDGNHNFIGEEILEFPSGFIGYNISSGKFEAHRHFPKIQGIDIELVNDGGNADAVFTVRSEYGDNYELSVFSNAALIVEPNTITTDTFNIRVNGLALGQIASFGLELSNADDDPLKAYAPCYYGWNEDMIYFEIPASLSGSKTYIDIFAETCSYHALPTLVPTNTPTATFTSTPSPTSTFTPVPSFTSTATVTNTPTATNTLRPGETPVTATGTIVGNTPTNTLRPGETPPVMSTPKSKGSEPPAVVMSVDVEKTCANTVGLNDDGSPHQYNKAFVSACYAEQNAEDEDITIGLPLAEVEVVKDVSLQFFPDGIIIYNPFLKPSPQAFYIGGEFFDALLYQSFIVDARGWDGIGLPESRLGIGKGPEHYQDKHRSFAQQDIITFTNGFIARNATTKAVEVHHFFPEILTLDWELESYQVNEGVANEDPEYAAKITFTLDANLFNDLPDPTIPPENDRQGSSGGYGMELSYIPYGDDEITTTGFGGPGTNIFSGAEAGLELGQTIEVYANAVSDVDTLIGYAPCDYAREEVPYQLFVPYGDFGTKNGSFSYNCEGHGLSALDLTPPQIHYFDIENKGGGLSYVKVNATDNVAIDYVEFVLDETTYTLEPEEGEENTYGGELNSPVSDGEHDARAHAVDTSNNEAWAPPESMNPVTVKIADGGMFGTESFCYNVPCGDPVNPQHGGYADTFTDLIVNGILENDIIFNRTYSSFAAFGSGGGTTRYNFNDDGSPAEEEIIAGPQPVFGPGWSTNFGTMTIAEQKNAAWQILQVFYPTGRVANFTEEGDIYTCDAVLCFDEIKKTGDGYELSNPFSHEVDYFDADGKLIRHEDKNGNAIEYEYDGENRLVHIKTAGTRWIKVTYNAEGFISEVTASENKVIRYEYEEGLLVRMFDAKGGVTQYSYTENNQLEQIILPEGNSKVQMTYDEKYRVASQIVGESESYTFSYSEDDTSTTMTDAYGNITTYYFDELGRSIETKDALGNSEYYDFNDQFQRIYFKDKKGNEWHYSYDEKGNQVLVEGPEGYRVERTYDEDDQITEMVEFVGDGRVRTTTFEYDERGNMISICNANEDCSSIEYDEHGLPTDIYDFANIHTQNKYNVMGDLISTTNGESETNTYRYDGVGRLKKTISPEGQQNFFEYDGNDNLLTMSGPSGYLVSYKYDKNGNLIVERDPNGGTLEYTYDNSGNLLGIKNQLGYYSERYQYGLMSEVTLFGDAEGRKWTYEHDALQQVTDAFGPMGIHLEFELDSVGNLLSSTDAEGRLTQSVYDGLNRPVEIVQNVGVGAGTDKNLRTTYVYDLDGNILSITDPEGNTTTSEYNLLGDIILSRDAMGGETHYDYDAMGNLTSLINARNFETSFGYDNAHRLASVKDALGQTTSFEYTPNGNLQANIDPNEIVTYWQYDDLDRMIAEIQNYQSGMAESASVNVTTEFEYDLAGNLRFITDPRDFRSENIYDAAHRLVEGIDFAGGHTTFDYDKVNNLRSVTDDNDHTTNFVVNDLDQTISITNPEGHTVTLTYTKTGELLSSTDARENTTSYTLDSAGRVILMVDAEQGEWGYKYDRVGNILAEINALNDKRTYSYDDLYRLEELVDAERNSTSLSWDEMSNLLQTIDANGNPTNFVYDELDRLSSITNAEGETTGYEYDALDNLTRQIDADQAITKYVYDPLYRLNAVVENFIPAAQSNNDTNVTTQYSYDASGNLAEIINALNNITAFEYDGMGRLLLETDPLNNQWRYTYDGVGNMAARTDATGVLTEYRYFADNQLAQTSYPDGTFVDYQYDPNNNPLRVENALGVTESVYDALNRVTEVNDALNRVLEYEYDAVSNRIGITYPDGLANEYSYSPNQWMIEMIDGAGNKTSYEYDFVGNPTKIENPNATVSNLTYDKVYRTLSVIDTQTRGKKDVISSFDYVYNEVGHVTEMTADYQWRENEPITEYYLYDGLRRLAGMKDSQGDQSAYKYDAVGNRQEWWTNDNPFSANPKDGFTATYDYNAANQLEQVNYDYTSLPSDNRSVAYTYDANGNRIDRLDTPNNGLVQGTEYSYDYENRLTQVQDYQLPGSDGNRVERAVTDFSYDAGGRRLVSAYDPKAGASGVKETQYLFDGLDPVGEYQMLNGQYTNFYRGVLGRMASSQTFKSGTQGQLFYYHYNAKYDVAALTKQQGQSVHNYQYDSYGGVEHQSGNFTAPHNEYTLTGKETDGHTNLVYFGYRHYDPEVGLWLTQDAYRGMTVMPTSLHRYQYLYNNSLSYYDMYGDTPRIGTSEQTCNCGIVDTSHVDDDSESSLANRIYNNVSTGEKEFTINTEIQLKKVITLSNFGGEYDIVITKDNLTEKEEQEISLAIFRELSWRYEKTQGNWTSWIPGQSSYFSSEDLPSNTISFYANVMGVDWKKACYATETVCFTGGTDFSKRKKGAWTNWSGYLPAGLSACSTSAVWPEEFQLLQPNYDDWYIKNQFRFSSINKYMKFQNAEELRNYTPMYPAPTPVLDIPTPQEMMSVPGQPPYDGPACNMFRAPGSPPCSDDNLEQYFSAPGTK